MRTRETRGLRRQRKYESTRSPGFSRARLRETYAGRIVQASSLGAEDQVITDLIAKLSPADFTSRRSIPGSSTARRWP